MAPILLPNVLIGHASYPDGPTGCTVILCPEGAVAGLDVRGSASGTRQTDSLSAVHRVPHIHGILLAGGSSFGLDAGGGVLQYLEERGIGFDVTVTRVPIVPSAILFDLGFGNPAVRPDKALGYQACLNASAETPAEGSVGAGTGATIGKIFSVLQATKGGLGYSAVRSEEGLIVAALVVVNAFGDVRNLSGKIIAGARTGPEDRTFADTWACMKKGMQPKQFMVQNTTLGVVLTNARLDKAEARKLAQLAQNGLIGVIAPVHTLYDGDILFALSVGRVEAPLMQVGILAQEMVQAAVIKAVQSADGLGRLPAWRDLQS
ncbi:MAG: P1 family peptidase [Deltaproteobacteria bacterium]|nr:P1 family peptidase [Deltaproteobacteria bacterium]